MQSLGTAILVGNDLVLTNYHVASRFIDTGFDGNFKAPTFALRRLLHYIVNSNTRILRQLANRLASLLAMGSTAPVASHYSDRPGRAAKGCYFRPGSLTLQSKQCDPINGNSVRYLCGCALRNKYKVLILLRLILALWLIERG